jgi:heme-degrading monooxygenase HmoA
MIVVIFEAKPSEAGKQAYLDAAAVLRPQLDDVEGFLAIERFESLSEPGKILSLSTWRDEAAVRVWRNAADHRAVQEQARRGIFEDYRLRVALVIRDYGMTDRSEAPGD